MKRFFYPAALALLILAGTILRLYDLHDAPLDYHATRQLHSALIARGMYFASTSATEIEEWQRQEAIRQQKLEGVIEPPIMEWLASRGYLLAGGPELWIPRTISIFFWIFASIGIAIIAHEALGKSGAVAALSFFLFYPYGVIASRSFQPESMLLATMIWGMWALLRWQKQGGWMWAIIAGILCGLALLVKAVSIFFLFGLWAGVLLFQPGWKKNIYNSQLWLAGLLVLLPTAFYTIYGVFGSGSLTGQFGLRFFPAYWKDLTFYVRWFFTLRRTVELSWLAVGFFGLILLENGSCRRALLGLWTGYALLGFVLSYHISTHDYYSLPVMITTSLGIGALLSWIWAHLPEAGKRLPLSAVIATTILVFSYDAYSTLKRTDYKDEIVFWTDLGNSLGRDVKITALVQDYGYRLEYWGWVTPTNWMSTGDFRIRADAGNSIDFQQYFENSTQGRSLFLITDMQEYAKQPELQRLLEDNYKLVEKSERVLIFDLTNSIE